MFGTGLIVFRETLEAALFMGIVAASTRGVIHRTRWLSFGVAAGAIGSLLMASAMDLISSWADGIGQEIDTLCIMSIALGVLAWHCILVSPNSNQKSLLKLIERCFLFLLSWLSLNIEFRFIVN